MQPFVRKALEILEKKKVLTATELHTKALALIDLKEPEQAVAALRTAVAREPSQAEWRYELASLLYAQGRLLEAHQELRAVLTYLPGHGQARKLLSTIANKSDEPKSPPR